MRMRFPIFGLDEGVFKGSQSVYRVELLFFCKSFLANLWQFSHDRGRKRPLSIAIAEILVLDITFR